MKTDVAVYRFKTGLQGEYELIGVLSNHLVFEGTWYSGVSICSGPIVAEKALFCKIGTDNFKIQGFGAGGCHVLLPGKDIYDKEIDFDIIDVEYEETMPTSKINDLEKRVAKLESLTNKLDDFQP